MSKEKLKTLKDFEATECEDVCPKNCVGRELLREELKEEAKKWISQIQAKIKEKEGKFDDLGIDLGMEYAKAGEAIIGFIKTFFNLEEEK